MDIDGQTRHSRLSSRSGEAQMFEDIATHTTAFLSKMRLGLKTIKMLKVVISGEQEGTRTG